MEKNVKNDNTWSVIIILVIASVIMLLSVGLRTMKTMDMKETEESLAGTPARISEEKDKQQEEAPVRIDDEKRVAAQLVVGERTVFCSVVGDNEIAISWADKEGVMAVRVNLDKEEDQFRRRIPK